jgi:hypothetical protein
MVGRTIMSKSEDGAEELRKWLTRRKREVGRISEIMEEMQYLVYVRDVRGNRCV